MCTVIYIPTEKGFILSSNRDENPNRDLASLPVIQQVDQIQILSPKDGLAGGTWIGLNSNKHFIILLNGAFEKHVSTGNYLKSRGLIVSELLAKSNPITHWKNLDLTQIEAFTLVVYAFDDLYHLVWDGLNKHTFLRDRDKAHIWSSSTLYDPIAKLKRETDFEIWLSSKPIFNCENLHQFLTCKRDNENGFVMYRNENLRTLSISFLEQSKSISSFQYNDLIKKTSCFKSISYD